MFFDILRQTFQIFLSTPLLLIYPVITWVITYVVGLLLTPILSTQNLVIIVFTGILLAFLMGIFSLMATVASCYTVYMRLKGEEFSIMDGINLAIARIRQIASFIGLLFIVLTLWVVAYALIIVIPAFACIAFVLSIGFLIFAIGSILVYPVIGVEGLSGTAAYRRSAQLVNNTKSVIGFLILFGFIIGLIFSFIFAGLITPRDIEIMQRTGVYPSSLGIIANPFFQFVLSILINMLSSIFTTVWYAKAIEKVDTPLP